MNNKKCTTLSFLITLISLLFILSSVVINAEEYYDCIILNKVEDSYYGDYGVYNAMCISSKDHTASIVQIEIGGERYERQKEE